jgi:hypothetical protein
VGVTTRLTFGADPELAVVTAARRGMQAAGDALLALSDALAPTEPEPRHDVHMVETGFARVELGRDGGDQVAVGYDAYWAVFQHEDLEYEHVHGGQAKFLETAVLEGEDVALAIIADTIREAIGG